MYVFDNRYEVKRKKKSEREWGEKVNQKQSKQIMTAEMLTTLSQEA